MKRKIVGITCSSLGASGRSGPRQMLNRAYTQAVERAGGVPIVLPVTSDPEVARGYLAPLDGLLLSGGVDVDPAVFGEKSHPALGVVDQDRDTTEMALIRAALDADLPIFAICRGIQALNVAMGGTLFQDLPAQMPTGVSHAQDKLGIPRDTPTHTIRLVPGSRMESIVRAEYLDTNSFHHQALKEVAPGLTVTARAEDDVIEAVEGDSHRFLLAVQFHPEETAPTDAPSHRLFKAFIDAL